MNKKIFMVCAMLIMCVFMFAACNKNDGGDVSTTATTNTTQASEKEDLGDRVSSAADEAVTDISEMLPTTSNANTTTNAS